MPAVKTERMTKGTRARKLANRRLPKILRKRRTLELAAFREAKRPRPPRWLQRQWRLAAKARAKQATEQKQSLLAAMLGVNPEAAA